MVKSLLIPLNFPKNHIKTKLNQFPREKPIDELKSNQRTNLPKSLPKSQKSINKISVISAQDNLR